MNNKPIIEWLRNQGRIAWVSWIYASFSGLISAAGFMVFAIYTARYADELLNHRPANVSFLVIAFFAVLIRSLGHYFYLLHSNNAAVRVIGNIRKRMISSLLRTPSVDASDGSLYFKELTDRLKPFYSRYIPAAIQSLLVPFFILAVVFIHNWIVGSILLLSYGMIPLQLIAVGIGTENIHRKQIFYVQKLSGLFLDRIQAMPTIKRLGRADAEAKRINRAAGMLEDSTMKLMKTAMLSSGLMEFFSTFSMAIIAIYIGMGLLKYIHFGFAPSGITLSEGLFLLMIAPYFFQPLRKFVAAYHDRNDAIAAAEHLMPLTMKLDDESVSPNSNEILNKIAFNSVSYLYPSRTSAAIENIFMQLPSKGIVLISGPSGSGKSTLLLLLSGYLRPSTGTIIVNNLNINESFRWLKNNCAWMGQHSFLFDGTLEENIVMNEPVRKVDLELLKEDVHLKSLLKKKVNGLKTIVHENGFGLSGGERQRIGLTRMLYHPKPVLLMDEPTAHADPETAGDIFCTLKKLSEDHCLILASHHAAAFEIADRIIFLEDGAIKQIDERKPKNKTLKGFS